MTRFIVIPAPGSAPTAARRSRAADPAQRVRLAALTRRAGTLSDRSQLGNVIGNAAVWLGPATFHQSAALPSPEQTEPSSAARRG